MTETTGTTKMTENVLEVSRWLGSKVRLSGLLALLVFVAALLVTLVLPGVASAQTPIREDVQVYNCGSVDAGGKTGSIIQEGVKIASTFTASKTTSITRVDPLLSGNIFGRGFTDAIFELRTVDPQTGSPTDTVLGTTTVPKEQISSNIEYETARFGNGGVPVVEGMKYTLVLRTMGSGDVVWWGNEGNPCPGTVNYRSNAGGAFGQIAEFDSYFRLFETTPASVPVAVDDAYSVDEDATLTEDAPGVLGNDTDVEGDSLSAVLDTEPTNGNLTLNADGSFVYEPNENFNGSDSFTYRARDVDGNSAPARVTLTVSAVNDRPVAEDDSANTEEDTSVNIDVLSNDTDPDGNATLNPASVRIISPAQSGTATANPDGTVTYEPNADFNGVDSFEYEVCDTGGLCDDGAATINVTPVADEPDPDPTPKCTIRGTDGDDVLAGTNNRDVICGMGGSDTIRGMDGNDLIRGGYGNDTLYGNDGRDTLYGGPGSDDLYGGAGDDLLRGGAGKDTKRQ